MISIELWAKEKNIHGIDLGNPKSTTKVLGLNIWNKHFEANDMFPRIECLNINYSEGLRLFFHYGGTKNEVAEFELFSVDKNYKKPTKAVQLEVKSFKTGKGCV